MAAPFSSPSPTLLRHPLSSPSTRPPPDDLASSWLLEFILRQPIPDSLAHQLFLSLPFSSPADLHPHLRKTLLLRRISSDLLRRSLSHRTLHSLDLIADLDSSPSLRFKAAHSAAASFLRSAGEVSERDPQDAMRFVRDYLEEALGEVGPSFLEVAAAEFAEKRVDVGGLDMPDHSGCKIQQVDPGEIKKVKDALKKSCFDLKMAVEDPLPEAHAVAAAVLQSSVENPVLPVSPVELVAGVHTGGDSSTGDLEKEKWNSSDLKQMEGDNIVEACNEDAGPSKRRDAVASHSLFERNPTAHTSEWSDDSIESSAPTENLQSSNPMSRRISPTRLDKGKRVKRRAVKRWTLQEEHTLREAVAKYGKGNWKLILNCHSEIFEERTEVDLKDKWRNMARH